MNRFEINSDNNDVDLDTDTAINITVDLNVNKAFVMLDPPQGNSKSITSEDIMEELKKNGIVAGINIEIISSLVSNPIYNRKMCIAEGKFPTDGKDAKIDFFFSNKRKPQPNVNKDGSVDFRTLNILNNVSKGEVLCNITPPQEGIDGITVTGKKISAVKGRPVKIPVGKNVTLSEDGLNIFAAVDGFVEYSNDRINVFTLYEVPADVDNSTGNIKFNGNILIRGNVLAGFKVEAVGSVEVWGAVEGAVIKAGEDIRLHRGMQGMDKGVLQSEGNIFARYIEHSTIIAKGSVTVESIMHSKLKCGGKLELNGKKGLLVGGTYKAGSEITAKVIGSYLSTFTDIEVGGDPKDRELHKTVTNELDATELELKKAEQVITLLRKPENSGNITPDKESMLIKTIRTSIFLKTKISGLKREKHDIEVRLRNSNDGKVRCYNYLYSGTKLTIGNSTLYVKDTLQYCIAYNDGGNISIKPMNT